MLLFLQQIQAVKNDLARFDVIVSERVARAVKEKNREINALHGEIDVQRNHTKEKEKQIDGLKKMIGALELKLD